MESPWSQRLGFWWIAEDHPHLPAIVESPSGVALTFGELAARAHQIVHGLRTAGVVAGDVVAYALPNDADIIWWPLACQEMGVRSIALNPSLSAAEVGKILDLAAARGIVIDARYAELAAVARTAGPDLLVSVGGPLEGFTSYEDLVAGEPEARPDDRTFGTPISYSSGTTGKPKGIDRPPVQGDPSVIADGMKLFAQAFQMTPLEGVHLASAGMHHGGCQSFYQGAMNVGQAVTIMGRFDPEGALQMIERHQVTTAYMVPTQFVRLLRLPQEVRDRYDVSSLQMVVHSAAPCPMEVKRAMMDWWGPVLWETYGGMEGAAAIAKPHRWLERPGTVGRAVRGMRIRILDDAGRELPAGETGHVYLEPDRPTFEYRDDPDLTASVHRGKAFTLGDVGFLDEDGYLFLRDRAKDMIISGGVNIYPAEIEAVLGAHPGVRDVAVIGVPDLEWGESVTAVVELEPGVAGSPELEDELIEHCRARLARFKCPRSVDFRDALPRTEAGKLYKRLLRDEYWRETAGERSI
ncbi:MAG TPA: AMP-binding protein [Acidimicrobiales bacterium]|nr:AMP-binding protein [Acidimicrobiales bacterium]